MPTPNRLWIDGREHVVHGISRDRAGWMAVLVAPSDDRPDLIHAEMTVPSAWFESPHDNTRVFTGGHWFAKKAPR